jgi:hypothetical protein
MEDVPEQIVAPTQPVFVETPERIARHYSAALDSVSLINAIKAGTSIFTGQDAADALERNTAHLEVMLSKDFWGDEDLQPLIDAVESVRSSK